MTVRGHIENGTVVLDERVDLPEGAQVAIEIDTQAGPEWEAYKKTLHPDLRPRAGILQDSGESGDADLRTLHPELQRFYGILANVEDLDEAKLDALPEDCNQSTAE